MARDNSLANMNVKEVLARWPQTAQVFQQFNMACIGCVVAPYCTVAAAARDYDLPLEFFLAALEKALEE
ncbi:MAG: DUF1858 domain-containing protein [Anaerolineales bacterium]|nr:DUF1858 domain-containing protein [Anaerolineales bacterium]